jgi:hypothetical protein
MSRANVEIVRRAWEPSAGAGAYDRFMTNRAQLHALDEVHRRLELEGVAYWLFGGWAVDFHAGAVTRPHDDLDIAIWLRDLTTVARLLRQDGWTHEPADGQDGSTAFTRRGVRLELAFLQRDEDGEPYTPLTRGGRAAWAAGAFGEEVRTLAGVRARVIGLTALHEEKSGTHTDPAAAAKDRRDRATLEGLG